MLTGKPFANRLYERATRGSMCLSMIVYSDQTSGCNDYGANRCDE
jgi:hypothetical protein